MTVQAFELQALAGNLTALFHEDEEQWQIQMLNCVVAGDPQTRPMLALGKRLKYLSIKWPLYGSGWGPGGVTAQLIVSRQGWDSSSSAYTVYGITEPDPGVGTMTGTNVTVRELWYSEITDERSIAGEATSPVSLSNSKLIIASNSVAPATELFVTHREFYLNYGDDVGAYYAVARIPYNASWTPHNGADVVVVDVSATVIVDGTHRPLEDGLQRSLFPAVSCGCFWRSRLFGANLKGRIGQTTTIGGSSLAFTQGSNIAVLSDSAFPWREADIYKGVVNYDTNQIVAYISRILTPTAALFKMPKSVDDSGWPFTSAVLNNWGLGSDANTVFCSPIYVGEAGGGLSVSPFTWDPLDQIDDENLKGAGAEIKAIWRLGEDLVIAYDRALVMFQGNVTTDNPPPVTVFPIAENVGPFNPKTVWRDSAGALWFQSQGRIYQATPGRVVDATAGMQNVTLYDKFVDDSMDVPVTAQRASFSPQRNSVLIVNTTKSGDAPSERRKYGLLMSHDSSTIHTVRFPVPVSAIVCSLYASGLWQWFAAANDWIYRCMVRGIHTDTFYDSSNALQSNVNVDYKWRTGVDRYDGTAYLTGFQIVLLTDLAMLDMQIAIDARRGNVIPTGFNPATTITLTADDLNREVSLFQRISGRGFQFEISGSANGPLELVELNAALDLQPLRGIGRESV